jgi:hypothetical protein
MATGMATGWMRGELCSCQQGKAGLCAAAPSIMPQQLQASLARVAQTHMPTVAPAALLPRRALLPQL